MLLFEKEKPRQSDLERMLCTCQHAESTEGKMENLALPKNKVSQVFKETREDGHLALPKMLGNQRWKRK